MSSAPPREMKVSEKEMHDAKLPIMLRDYCAHDLIPLNQCRAEHFYLPWKCTHERHKYEACQYREWLIRTGDRLKQQQPK